MLIQNMSSLAWKRCCRVVVYNCECIKGSFFFEKVPFFSQVENKKAKVWKFAEAWSHSSSWKIWRIKIRNNVLVMISFMLMNKLSISSRTRDYHKSLFLSRWRLRDRKRKLLASGKVPNLLEASEAYVVRSLLAHLSLVINSLQMKLRKPQEYATLRRRWGETKDIKQIHLWFRGSAHVKDPRRSQNVIRKSATRLVVPRVPLFCSYYWVETKLLRQGKQAWG